MRRNVPQRTTRMPAAAPAPATDAVTVRVLETGLRPRGRGRAPSTSGRRSRAARPLTRITRLGPIMLARPGRVRWSSRDQPDGGGERLAATPGEAPGAVGVTGA